MPRFSTLSLRHLCFVWFLFEWTQGSRDMHSSAIFTLAAKGARIKNYVIEESQTYSEIECAHLCLFKHPFCKSINYEVKDGMRSVSRHKCQLNNATKSRQVEHFVKDEAFNYFEMVQDLDENLDENNKEPFTANFTNLGASGRFGPTSLGSFYAGQDHENMVTLVSGIQHWTVPFTGTYRITAVGASGGYYSAGSSARGRGAYMRGDFELKKGKVIKILVGQQGFENAMKLSGGGGGGTFVVKSREKPLIVAGGGGGTKSLSTRLGRCDANTGTAGNQNDCKICINNLSGGVNGNGALEAADNSGGGGGGFKSSGKNFHGTKGFGREGGKGFLQGGVGGSSDYYKGNGGFGGGGCAFGEGGGAGGGGAGGGGAGGGGGYSGGASGDVVSESCGGGGGSYNVGKNQVNISGYQANGLGFVEINRLV